MHLQAGVRNGTTVEYQLNSAGACKAFFKGYPEPENGWIDLPKAPGLGFAPDMDAVREFTVA
jgi:L-alanine-DL-glutamate epimerase-like enolase superfamily enzyme